MSTLDELSHNGYITCMHVLNVNTKVQIQVFSHFYDFLLLKNLGEKYEM